MKQKTNIPSLGGNGPPCPSFGKHLYLWDGSLACGEMEKREGEWLERQRVPRHSNGKHNDRERRIAFKVTPTPLFIVFSLRCRVLSPWSGL